MNSIDTSQVDVSANSSIVTQTYQAASAAGTGVSLASVQSAFATVSPSAQVQAQIAQLKANGLTPTLGQIRVFLMQAATLFEVSSNAPAAHLMRTSLNEPGMRRINMSNGCGVLNLASGAIGTAAGSLALGCLPEPFFVVICPAVAVLGAIALAIGIVDIVLC
jgi:hypothetical protein